MSEQRSSEWLSIETMRPPSETEVWLYAKIDGAEITKKGRISKTYVCVEHAALYSVDPLRKLLPELVDFDLANSGKPRFTLGLVGVRSGRIRYFDSRDEKIGLDHVLGSSAVPPTFPAVRIDGEADRDGGIYSGTREARNPIEAHQVEVFLPISMPIVATADGVD